MNAIDEVIRIVSFDVYKHERELVECVDHLKVDVNPSSRFARVQAM